MNLITPPGPPGNQFVSDVMSDEESLTSTKLSEEDLHEFADLPQGVLTLIAQIQPMHQHMLSLAVGESGGAAVKPGNLPSEDGESVKQSLAPRGVMANSELPMRQFSATKMELHSPGIAAVAEFGSLSNTISQVSEKNEDDAQAILIPVQVSFEKHQSLLAAVQTPVAIVRPGGDNAPLTPMPLLNENTGYLKVPFNKGEMTGHVIVNKLSAEAPQQLLLSTNNADVLSLLRESVQLLDVPRWRLADHQEEKQDQGQRSSSEESDENTGDGNRRELMTQEVDV